MNQYEVIIAAAHALVPKKTTHTQLHSWIRCFIYKYSVVEMYHPKILPSYDVKHFYPFITVYNHTFPRQDIGDPADK